MTKLTEADVLQLLRERHTATGNGGAGEHAFLPMVRNAAGFSANRTFDAIAVNLWPSRGLTIHVFEVKVSRSDWRRELAKPDKAEDACKVADFFWIVAPAGCVQDGELPPGWGLIEVRGDGDERPWKLHTKHHATLLHDDLKTANRPISRGLLVGMLRSCPGAVPGGKVPPPSKAELDAEYQRGVTDAEASAAKMRPYRELERDRKLEALDKLTAALVAEGCHSFEADPDSLASHAASIAKALQSDDADRTIERVRAVLQTALATLAPAVDTTHRGR